MLGAVNVLWVYQVGGRISPQSASRLVDVMSSRFTAKFLVDGIRPCSARLVLRKYRQCAARLVVGVCGKMTAGRGIKYVPLGY